MSIVKLYNKDRDVTYVYDSISYWDKDKKQPRSKRKLIGKIDPETGEIVPTSPHKKNIEHPEDEYRMLYESALKDIAKKDQRISELEHLLGEYTSKELDVLQSIENILTERRNALDEGDHG